MNAPTPKKNARHGSGGRGVHSKANGNAKVTTALEAALQYARAGLRVVPLKERGKEPWLSKWTSAATSDPKLIEAWWTKRPDSNVGLLPPEGCVVVDIDPRNGGSAESLGLPGATPTQHTGGGGMHYVVRVPNGAVLPKVPGVDYLEPGKRQFVAWPSVHPNGKPYEWQAGHEPWAVEPALWQPPGNAPAAAQASTGGSKALAPLPLHQLGPTTYPLAQVREWLAVVRSDEYHDWINVGQALKHAYGDDAFDLWNEWSSRSDKYTSGADCEKKWATFDKNRDRALRTMRSVRHLAQQHGWREPGADAARQGAIPVVQLADFASKAHPPRWLMRGWVPAGAQTILLGESSAGKTTFAVAFAMAVAGGRDRFCHQSVRAHGAVVYIVAEGIDGMYARARIYAERVLRLEGEAQRAVPIFFVPVAVSLSIREEAEATSDQALQAINAWATRQGVAPPPVMLVVVDTLNRNIGGDADENSNMDMSKMLNNCEVLQERLSEFDKQGQRPAVLLNAHPGHASKERIRGAYALKGNTDVVLLLEAMGQEIEPDEHQRTLADLFGEPLPVGRLRQLRTFKGRDSGAPPPVTMQFLQVEPRWLADPETGEANSVVYLDPTGEFGPVGEQARTGQKVSNEAIVSHVRTYPNHSQRQWAEQLGITHQVLGRRLATLRQAGKLPKAKA